MARFWRVAGGIVVGVVTLVVAVAAAYALWLGAPLLNPGTDAFGASDIPIINTDAKILVPIPEKAQVSPRAGVIQPTPPVAKPKPQKASNTPPAKRPAARVTRVVAKSAKPRTTAKVAVASHESDDDERSTRREDSERSEDSSRSDSSKGSDSSSDESSDHGSSKDESSKSGSD